jgi:hypothetical protein
MRIVLALLFLFALDTAHANSSKTPDEATMKGRTVVDPSKDWRTIYPHGVTLRTRAAAIAH